jgi:protein-S-isoprenylcysteine O-methyltransferase Ste14
MYQQELAHSGRALFVIRGHYINAIIAIGIGVAYWIGDLGPFADEGADMAWFALSFAVALAGALIRVYTNGHAALGTSGKVKVAAEAAELNTTGAYSLVRNPLYVGRILNFTGLAMLTGSPFYGMLILFLSFFVYERISVYEEEFLRGKFGEAHARWAAEVPALIPRLHGWVPPRYPYWWRRMLWREYKKFFQFGTALFFYAVARHHFDIAYLLDHPSWYVSYGALCAFRLWCKAVKMRGFFEGMR